MPDIQVGTRPESVEFRAGVVLFVEGSGDSRRPSLDVQVFADLMRPLDLRVEPLGAAFSLTSVAQALRKQHPNYYFVIDRDSRPHEQVEDSWKGFLDPARPNLAVWRKRELESYFLDPDYLGRSDYLVKTRKELQESIIKSAGRRVFLDIANGVIESVREGLKQTWVQCLRDPAQVTSLSQAREIIRTKKEFLSRPGRVAQDLSKDHLDEVFDTTARNFLGPDLRTELDFSRGYWPILVSAKEVLHEVTRECCRVEDAAGKVLQGSKAVSTVARSLLRRPLLDQPEDFQKLYDLMRQAKDNFRA
jgi:hypothetical protein